MTEPLPRLPDWRQRLDDYLDSIDGKPFEWGELDCALYAAGAVQAMTGVDLAKSFRGQYSDAAGAKAAIAAAGFPDYASLVAAYLPEATADTPVGIGDIAVVDMPGFGPCLALVGGAHLTAMTVRGKGSLPRIRATRFFKVG